MMKKFLRSICAFNSDFIARGGLYVTSSDVFAKALSLLVSFVIVRFITKSDYGAISYALMVITVLLPLTSDSLSRSVLRYGAVRKSQRERNIIYNHYFRKGLFLPIVFIVPMTICATYICLKKPESLKYFYPLLSLLFLNYLYGMRQTKMRLANNNRAFALLSFVRALLMLVCVLAFVPFYGGYGYVTSLLIAPLFAVIIALFFFRQPDSNVADSLNFKPKGIVRFALFVGFSGLLSKLQLFLDGIFIANLLPDLESLSNYRVASLIPINLVILPAIFFKTEYVHLAENHEKPKFIIKYLKRYLSMALFLCLSIVSVTQFFGEEIITLIFGGRYIDSGEPFKILILGVCGSFLLRQPFGILNNVSGRVDLNLLNGVMSILLTGFLLSFLVPRHGLMGAAMSTAIMLWLSGILSATMYFTFVYRKLK